MVDVTLQGTLAGHQNPIYILESGQESRLYSAGNDKGVVEWDLSTMSFKRILCAVPSSVYAMHAIPNTDLLAIGMRSGEIFVVDTTNQSLKAKLKVDKGAVFCIKSLAAKQELIATGEEGKVYVWSLASFELLYSFRLSDTTIRYFDIDNEERYVAFGDKVGTLYIVQASDYQLIAKEKVHEMSVTSLCFYDDFLLSGGRDAKMFKLSYPQLEVIDSLTPHMFTVYGITKLNNSFLSSVSRDKTLKIWNTALKLQKNISRDKGIDSHFLSINSQSFHAHLNLLATAGDDKMIKIWKIDI